jgi:hypothetical protein
MVKSGRTSNPAAHRSIVNRQSTIVNRTQPLDRLHQRLCHQSLWQRGGLATGRAWSQYGLRLPDSDPRLPDSDPRRYAGLGAALWPVLPPGRPLPGAAGRLHQWVRDLLHRHADRAAPLDGGEHRRGGVHCFIVHCSLLLLHLSTAESIGTAELLVAAASGIGGGLASVISPAKLQNAAASIDRIGEEAQVIPTTFAISLVITGVCAVMALSAGFRSALWAF